MALAKGWAFSSLYLPLDRMVDVVGVFASWMKGWGGMAQGVRMKVFQAAAGKVPAEYLCSIPRSRVN